MPEFVLKASLNAARHLRLFDRGHFSEGAVADITLIDEERACAKATYINGVLTMRDGVLYGTGMTVITTPRGEQAVSDAGYPSIVIDLATEEPERVRG